MKTTFSSQLITALIYNPTTGMYAKPTAKMTHIIITITMKTMMSTIFLMTKSKDLLVLSIASVPSIIAIVIINKATGMRINVMKHIAEIIAATISVLNLLTTRLMLFFRSMERPPITSLAISVMTQPAIKPTMDAMK